MMLVGVSALSQGEAVLPAEAPQQDDAARVSELSDRQVAQIEQAETVAVVSVTNVSSLINRALSLPGMLSVEAYTYQLAVGHQWKGQISTGAELRIELKHCSQPLKKGERYLVMMEKAKQQWIARDCDQVIAIADAEAVLAYLNDHYLDRVAQK
tara:strand:+ start:47405 stop:47866 length:462 start_codon:yes stop_codon:yes gene_type:complete